MQQGQSDGLPGIPMRGCKTQSRCLFREQGNLEVESMYPQLPQAIQPKENSSIRPICEQLGIKSTPIQKPRFLRHDRFWGDAKKVGRPKGLRCAFPPET